MAEPPDRAVRASDADRERAADWLRRAAGDGQLTIDELDARLHEAFTVRTRGELEALTADLQSAGDLAPRVTSSYTVRAGEGGERRLLAIMGGCRRSGAWRLGASCTVLSIMGGVDLDLNQVELGADRVELSVYSIMGGVEIHLPHGLNVEVSQFAFMGGNDIEISEAGPPRRALSSTYGCSA